MTKFCMKCGSEIPENSEFCPKCGKKLGGSNSSAGNRNVLPFVIGGGIAIAVVVLAISLVLVRGGDSSKKVTGENILESIPGGKDSENETKENSPESVALEFWKAYYSGDADKFAQLMLPAEYDSLIDEEYDSLESNLKEDFKEWAKTAKEEYGTITFEYESKEKLTGDELDENKDILSSFYGINISEAYYVTLKVTAKGTTDSFGGSEDFAVVKYDGKYYVFAYDFM